MIYGSLQHNGHTNGHGTPIFDSIIVYASKSINNDNEIFWRLKNIVRFDN